ncbi:MAG TPA: flagellar basal body rod protein FlgC, partial [Rhizomicrobium sp.]|nr:flagellar basal body rod protein FlgC [Rhizomicrobium sp.]
ALDVEWRRLEIIAQNLANANSTGGVDGAVYHAQRLISGPKASFDRYIDSGSVDALQGVAVQAIETDAEPPRLVHEPGNPRANAAGFVAYPAIDHAEQMTLMMRTERAYEANIVAMNAARQMYSKALELGKRA